MTLVSSRSMEDKLNAIGAEVIDVDEGSFDN